jgi:hypothetical protein
MSDEDLGYDPDEMEKILSEYASIGVTKDRIEARFGHAITEFSQKEISALSHLLTAIRCDIITADDEFPLKKVQK